MALTMQQQLEAANSDLSQTREELTMYKQLQDEKLDQSKQFQQLKKMIATKNAQLKDTRVRLARYETDDTPVAEE